MFRDIMSAEELISHLEPKIKKELLQTNLQNRDDLEQHIKLKIVEKKAIINQITAPNLEEFIDYYLSNKENPDNTDVNCKC